MNIYLGESVFPSFENDQLVFKASEITLGDWKEDRKVSLDVPISDVHTALEESLCSRECNIMDPCLLTSSSQKAELRSIQLILLMILKQVIILSNVGRSRGQA